ncbi:MAG: methylated-DNA--[protein]-cysteine S-methyltransferase [Oscillospiraceae bacterium]
MEYCCEYASPLGLITLVGGEEALTGLYLEGQRYPYAGDAEKGETPVLALARTWLDRYFAGERPPIGDIPLAPEGGAFRQTVWRLLCEIPYGQVVTYGELARKAASRLGKEKMAAQAVGGAVGHNPISILIPCHRVVGADGSLTGYGGGIERKLWLLRHESADLPGLYVPGKKAGR